jgi:hypothetical protein
MLNEFCVCDKTIVSETMMFLLRGEPGYPTLVSELPSQKWVNTIGYALPLLLIIFGLNALNPEVPPNNIN